MNEKECVLAYSQFWHGCDCLTVQWKWVVRAIILDKFWYCESGAITAMKRRMRSLIWVGEERSWEKQGERRRKRRNSMEWFQGSKEEISTDGEEEEERKREREKERDSEGIPWKVLKSSAWIWRDISLNKLNLHVSEDECSFAEYPLSIIRLSVEFHADTLSRCSSSVGQDLQVVSIAWFERFCVHFHRRGPAISRGVQVVCRCVQSNAERGSVSSWTIVYQIKSQCGVVQSPHSHNFVFQTGQQIQFRVTKPIHRINCSQAEIQNTHEQWKKNDPI